MTVVTLPRPPRCASLSRLLGPRRLSVDVHRHGSLDEGAETSEKLLTFVGGHETRPGDRRLYPGLSRAKRFKPLVLRTRKYAQIVIFVFLEDRRRTRGRGWNARLWAVKRDMALSEMMKNFKPFEVAANLSDVGSPTDFESVLNELPLVRDENARLSRDIKIC